MVFIVCGCVYVNQNKICNQCDFEIYLMLLRTYFLSLCSPAIQTSTDQELFWKNPVVFWMPADHENFSQEKLWLTLRTQWKTWWYLHWLIAIEIKLTPNPRYLRTQDDMYFFQRRYIRRALFSDWWLLENCWNELKIKQAQCEYDAKLVLVRSSKSNLRERISTSTGLLCLMHCDNKNQLVIYIFN